MSQSIGRAQHLQDWLLYSGRYIEDFETFVGELAKTLNLFGFELSRLNLGVYILHPDIAGVAFQWIKEGEAVASIPVEHSDLETPVYLESPIRACVNSGQNIRIQIGKFGAASDFPVVAEFQKSGITDYCVMPLPGGSERVNVWSLATTRPGGFTNEEWSTLQRFSLYLSLVVDYLAVQWLAGVLMQVYLGRRTGKRVLRGQVKRGDGQEIRAALWFCDMRGFTQLSSVMTSEELIVILNEYFGRLGPAVQEEGGEILKFIGDAMLAIFPMGEDDDDEATVCKRCLKAAEVAQATLEEWSQSRTKQGQQSIRTGIALHIGEVVYGNIGTPGRLDFTVIGEAVNRVARVEGMCTSLGEGLLATKEFIEHIDRRAELLGAYELKGIRDDVEIYAIRIDS